MKFLGQQYSERDGVQRKFFAGCFGIFGHGNVAGLGPGAAAVRTAGRPASCPITRAATSRRWCTSPSATPGSWTGCRPSRSPRRSARVPATCSPAPRWPPSTGCRCCCCPATSSPPGSSSPVLQELEQPYGYDISVNDAFRPVSRFFDRVWRAEQLPAALLGAMRVLTDPAETGAATIALPEDVQAEAHDWPVELFTRAGVADRPAGRRARGAATRPRTMIRGAGKPIIVSGGGVTYAEANDALRAFVEATGIPITETQAGKGSLPFDHPLNLGRGRRHRQPGREPVRPAGRRGHRDRHQVLGFHHRVADDLPEPRRPVRQHQRRRDRRRQARRAAGAGRRQAHPGGADPVAGRLFDRRRSTSRRRRQRAKAWDDEVVASFHSGYGAEHGVLAQAEVLGAVDEAMDARDVVVCAAGSLPGDLHGMWRTRDRKGYHVEYGYSCMGYEIPGGIGIRMAAPGPGRVRHRRRRLLPDDADRAGHRGAGGHQDHRGAAAEPRLRLDRLARRIPWRATVRHEVPLPQQRLGPAGRRHPAGRPGRQRRQPGRQGAQGLDAGGTQGRPGQGQGIGDRGAGARRHRPGVPVAWRRRVVGRPGRRDVSELEVTRKATTVQGHLRRASSADQRADCCDPGPFTRAVIGRI